MKMSQGGSREPKTVRRDETFNSPPPPPGRDPRNAFTLIEVMVVVTLLSLIVLALMAVFNSTQRAFRASITQTDVLEGGRATMDLITADLRAMSPSSGVSNNLANGNSVVANVLSGLVPVNFYVSTNYNEQPLVQSLVASSQQRTNVLENFFILSRNNQTWTGTGYVVDPTSTNFLNPLYRFSMSINVQAASPASLFTNFLDSPLTGPGWSHLMDGVVHLTVRAYDTNGVWMTNGYVNPQNAVIRNVVFQPSTLGEVGFYMLSNTLPVSVEIQLGALEDRTLQRAGTWANNSSAQNSYLAGQSGNLHIFRQRVTISNVDPTAYQ